MLRLRNSHVSGPIALVVSIAVMVATALAWGLSSSTAAAPQAAAGVPVAQSPAGSMESVVRGTTADGRRVTGSFIPLDFKKRDGKVFVRGLVRGAVKNENGTKRTFAAMRTVRVAEINGVPIRTGAAAREALAQAPCDVLNLRLGPLDLDLLGLEINLNRIVLDIVAQSGAGKLLGNLLCAVAGLLDGGLGGVLGRLTNLLDRILGRLGLGI